MHWCRLDDNTCRQIVSDAKVLSLFSSLTAIRVIYKPETLCYTSDRLVVN